MRIQIPAAPFVFFLAFSLLSVAAFAATREDIQYPVAELGNCESEFDCGVYCGDPAHKAECDVFIEKYNLDKKEKLEKIKFPIEELGNCESREACEQYCEQPENFEVCIEFGEEHELIEEYRGTDDVEAGKRFARLVREGKTPGGCTTEKTCIEYCSVSEHFEECLKFVDENDLVSDKEIEMAKKRGSFGFEGPGGCTDEKSCKSYCAIDSNFDECIKFLEEEELIPQHELDMLKRTGSFRGPGGCLMDECENYCNNPDNVLVCMEWGHEHGMISDQEYEMIKKTGGRGPGGCFGEECRDYCEKPENMETCFNFGCEHGFMDAQICERGFEQMRDMMMRGGPGGCSGEQECRAYCEREENREECMRFSGGGERHQEFFGPGGCRGEEECRAYCDSHPEECWGGEHGEGQFGGEGQFVEWEEFQHSEEGEFGETFEGFEEGESAFPSEGGGSTEPAPAPTTG